MNRVLILGGGFGGIAAAHALREQLKADDEIILVERKTHFMMGLRKTWALLDAAAAAPGQRALALLEGRGIKLRQGTIQRIDPAGLAAEINGERVEADALIVALGAQHATDKIPGLADALRSPYDPDKLPQAADALKGFGGGRVVIGIFGLPYPCPPAPYELALLLSDWLKARGIKATLEVFSPQPITLPVVGAAGCATLDSRLESYGIAFRPNAKATAVEGREVVLADGGRIPFDLLLGVAAHHAPEVVRQSGLVGASGWVEANPETLGTQYPGVYAIGDVTQILMANGSPLPKAGALAEAEAQTAAANIADRLTGRAPSANFEGKGGCFLEAGSGQAMMIEGHFMAKPAPDVTLTEPSEAYMKEKHAFEADRLRAWFGE